MIAHLCAAIVGVLLAYAGANKVTSFQQWRTDAAQQNIPAVIAFIVPACELFLGAVLVVVSPTPEVLGAATLVLLVFTVYLSAQVIGKSEVPCACFGSRNKKPPSWLDVVRNCVLISLLLISALLSS